MWKSEGNMGLGGEAEKGRLHALRRCQGDELQGQQQVSNAEQESLESETSHWVC
jgi:hypothetical protein